MCLMTISATFKAGSTSCMWTVIVRNVSSLLPKLLMRRVHLCGGACQPQLVSLACTSNYLLCVSMAMLTHMSSPAEVAAST